MLFINNFFYFLFLFFSLLIFFLGIWFLIVDNQVILEFDFLTINSVSLEFILFLDWMSFIFSSFVLFISSMILKYSGEYMEGDKNFIRFILLMILFVFSMMFMILSPNLISILLGWDGLGLVSYALVIYYQGLKSFNAGMLTALSNRIGDVALLLCIGLMMNFGSWNLMNFMEFLKSDLLMVFVSVLIILASMTKSAQIPFSSWLPAAMAAPTPVSSLVHSSTLVTAGVYLLIRFNILFSDFYLNILLFCSMMTMFMAGLAANFEFDLKKIIALSTLSQLGMMVVILCVGGSDLAFFHLLIHAFFKALLFMCAGAIIHNLGSNQDIRFMGSLNNFFPVTCSCFTVSSLSLCGLPFLSGFYSKDLIVEVLSMKFSSLFIYVIFYISVGLTTMYSVRLVYYMYMNNVNFSSLNNFSDYNNNLMLSGMTKLVFLVIFKGSLLSWLIFSVPYFIILPFIMKLMTFMVILIGMFLGYQVSILDFSYNFKCLSVYSTFMYLINMWNLPILSTFGLNLYFIILGKNYYSKLDHGWFEYYGSKGLFSNVNNFLLIFQLISINHLKFFMLLIFMFIMFLLILSMF